MSSCLFCDIVAGKIPCDEVYRDDEILAFRDIAPQAPTHILVIPHAHIASLADLAEDQTALVGRLAWRATRLAAAEGLDPDGYRLVVNCGRDGGQTVGHLHLHVLGGRGFGWPPG